MKTIGKRKFYAYLYTATLLFSVTVLSILKAPLQATGIIASFGGASLSVIAAFIWGNKEEHKYDFQKENNKP